VSKDVKEKVFIYGASGHAKVVIDIVEKQGKYEISFLVDDDLSLKGTLFFGYKVVGGKEELLTLIDRPVRGIVAIGSNQVRCNVATWLIDQGFSLITAIHPTACIGRNVVVNEGTVIMAGVIINSDTTVGKNVIVNSCASIDHDCQIGDNVHIAPGSTLCGSVSIDEGTFVCAGATVAPNIYIGKQVIVGAGATVIRDVSEKMTVVGVPASGRVRQG